MRDNNESKNNSIVNCITRMDKAHVWISYIPLLWIGFCNRCQGKGYTHWQKTRQRGEMQSFEWKPISQTRALWYAAHRDSTPDRIVRPRIVRSRIFALDVDLDHRRAMQAPWINVQAVGAQCVCGILG